ncbi:hypothetical protein HMPREF1989_00159 [Porphyromonas gingivalis F0566]|nr:hypothetical protein HMPREF1989_00159 [Porphyromonas gingivalis F0566]
MEFKGKLFLPASIAEVCFYLVPKRSFLVLYYLFKTLNKHKHAVFAPDNMLFSIK